FLAIVDRHLRKIGQHLRDAAGTGPVDVVPRDDLDRHRRLHWRSAQARADDDHLVERRDDLLFRLHSAGLRLRGSWRGDPGGLSAPYSMAIVVSPTRF